MRPLIVRKLIVDDRNEIFDERGMKQLDLPGDFTRVREYAALVAADCPVEFKDGNLMEQQLSELIKNAIKHGNRLDPAKAVRIRWDFRKRARVVVEDEGEGFRDLDAWNDFYRRRQEALHREDFEAFLGLASYRGPRSTEEDGGNSLVAALEYWNGGMIYNAARNKVGVLRWYTDGSRRTGALRASAAAAGAATVGA